MQQLLVWSVYDRNLANPFADSVAVDVFPDAAETVIAIHQNDEASLAKRRVLRASRSMCQALSSPVHLFRIEVEGERVTRMCGRPVRLFGRMQIAGKRKHSALDEESGEKLEEQLSADAVLNSGNTPTLSELSKYAIKRGYMQDDAQSRRLLWAPIKDQHPQLRASTHQLSFEHAQTLTSALAQLMTFTCLANGTFEQQCKCIHTYGVSTPMAAEVAELIETDPAQLAMSVASEPLWSRFDCSLQNLWNCARKLDSISRYGHTAIKLNGDYSNLHDKQAGSYVVKTGTYNRQYLVLRACVSVSEPLAGILLDYHQRGKLLLTIRHPLDYLWHEYIQLLQCRANASARVTVFSMLHTQAGTLVDILGASVIAVGNKGNLCRIGGVHPSDTAAVPMAGYEHTVIVADAHRASEVQLLAVMKWCSRALVSTVHLFGVPNCMPRAEPLAGQPFRDMTEVLAPASELSQPIRVDWHIQRPLERPYIRSAEDMFEAMVLKPIQENAESPNWLVLVGTGKALKMLREQLKAFIKAHESKFRLRADRFPQDGGEKLSRQRVKTCDTVSPQLYDVVGLSYACGQRERTLALECTLRTSGVVVDIKPVGMADMDVDSRAWIQRGTYLRSVLGVHKINAFT